MNNTHGIRWPHSSVKDAWKRGIYEQGATEPWIQQLVADFIIASQARTVLELGCFLGLTTTWIACALEASGGGTLVGVELEPERAEATRAQLGLLDLNTVKYVIHQADAVSVLNMLDAHSIDLAWVDDDHTPAHVAQELDILCAPTRPESRKMASGGIVLMHDVFGPLGLDGVCSVYHGLPINLPKLGPAGGLGIIQVP